MSIVTFSPNTKILSADVNSNFSGLADGSLDTTANSLSQFRTDAVANCVISGGVWSGDSYGSTRAASMTAAVLILGGKRITVGAVTARSFTASKDTYIDVSDNGDGTGTLNYTEVSNNAASPALTAGRLRLAIIITGASSIASSGSVNQGEPTKVLPIASSIAYTTTDSLGNLICNRDPTGKLLGYRQITAAWNTTTTSSWVDVTGMSMPIIAPGNKRVQITIYCPRLTDSGAVAYNMGLREGSSLLAGTLQNGLTANATGLSTLMYTFVPSAGSHTYLMSIAQNGAGTINIYAAGTSTITDVGPTFIKAELL